MRRDLVVMGASAGGIDALRDVVAALPPDFPAAVCIVLHMAPESPGILGSILQRAGKLPARMVKARMRLEAGQIYIPCPDHHLVVEPGAVIATRGPRENRFRPSIDPLFRSAASVYGPRAIGVILTGGLDDGVAGLWALKQLGGVAIVQDPDEALVDSMPRNAIEHVRVDHVARVAEMPALLSRLVREDMATQGGYTVPEPMRIEVDVAREQGGLKGGVMRLGEPSAYACPACHGVLLQLSEGGRVRFRCHTGHAYSSEALIADFDDAIETALWNSVRALEEKVLLIRQLAGHAREGGDLQAADLLEGRAAEALRRSEALRRHAANDSAATGTDGG